MMEQGDDSTRGLLNTSGGRVMKTFIGQIGVLNFRDRSVLDILFARADLLNKEIKNCSLFLLWNKQKSDVYETGQSRR